MREIAKIINDKTIEVYDLQYFDIDATMHSGQVFRYFETSGGYFLIDGGEYAEIVKQDGKVLINCSDAAYFYNYFDFQTNYQKIAESFSRCGAFKKAVEVGSGIRILRADFYQTVISFIISANNNIKRFTKTLNLLSSGFGEKLPNGNFLFPKLERLLTLSESDFKDIGCGYRSRYLVSAVKSLLELDINFLSSLPNERLAKELEKISGVGPKVAACIMLFAAPFHRLNVAPVDTWIKKALEELSERERAAVLSSEFGGVLQQYIFYYTQFLRDKL